MRGDQTFQERRPELRKIGTRAIMGQRHQAQKQQLKQMQVPVATVVITPGTRYPGATQERVEQAAWGRLTARGAGCLLGALFQPRCCSWWPGGRDAPLTVSAGIYQPPAKCQHCVVGAGRGGAKDTVRSLGSGVAPEFRIRKVSSSSWVEGGLGTCLHMRCCFHLGFVC